MRWPSGSARSACPGWRWRVGWHRAIEPWLSRETRRRLVPAAADALAGALRLARAQARSRGGLRADTRGLLCRWPSSTRSPTRRWRARSAKPPRPSGASSRTWRGRWRAGRPARAAAAAGRRHLRARQLGACRDLRQAPDRALSRRSRSPRRRPTSPASMAGGCGSRTSCFSPSRNRDGATISSSWRTSAKSAGALTVAIVNATDGPLAAACDIVLPMGAGPERSVAATKTFVATLAALLRLTAAWTGDAALDGAIERAAGAAGRGRRARLERRRRRAGRHEQPGHHRPRADARHRARGIAQAEGDLQPACRGVQRRRVPAWSGGAGLGALSDADVHADRPGGAGHAPACSRPARQGRRAVCHGHGAARLRDGCPRCRPSSPKPTRSA